MESLSQLSIQDGYTYESLPDDRAIRLIQLLIDPRQPHGFSLTSCTVSLRDTPLYCALSYTWKSATISGLARHAEDDKPPALVTVQCDGKDLAVTENAFDFLCRAFRQRLFIAENDDQELLPEMFRLSEYQTTAQNGVFPQYVWIDAISINQRDVEERSHQVSFMGDIFQQSLTTIVWLGKEEPHPEAKWVIQAFMPRFLTLYRERGRHYFMSKDPACTDPAVTEYFGEEICSRWRSSFKFFFVFLIQRRWFLRGWVVQEVILRTLENVDDVVALCGSMSVLWSELLEFLEALTTTDWRRLLTRRLRSHEETKKYGFQFSDTLQRLNSLGIIQTRIQDGYHGQESSSLRRRFGSMTDTERAYAVLAETIHTMRGREFTDRRDAIYGCFGLVSCVLKPGAFNPIMAPNYHTPEVEVYKEAVWAILSNTPYLDLLNTIEDSSSRSFHNLPSWVPDFSSKPLPTRFMSIQTAFSGTAPFDASKRRSPTSAFSLTESKALTLRGVRLSVVIEQGPVLLSQDSTHVNFEWFLNALLTYQGQYAQTNDAPDEALCRTLFANIIPARINKLAYAETFRKWWSKHLVNKIRSLEEDLIGSSSNLISFLEQLSTGREWFPTLAQVFNAMIDERNDGPQIAALDTVRHRLWFCRRFFRTNDGRFGIGHRCLNASDEVWLLEGGRTPFILRKTADNSGYRVVGETYVHGIMYGELATPELLDQMGPVTLI